MSEHKMILLPAAKGRCQECATEHKPDMPHNKQSLFWSMKRKMEGKPPATWKIAMEHCSPEMQQAWTRELVSLGEIV